jgi:hypothetical protein
MQENYVEGISLYTEGRESETVRSQKAARLEEKWPLFVPPAVYR